MSQIVLLLLLGLQAGASLANEVTYSYTAEIDSATHYVYDPTINSFISVPWTTPVGQIVSGVFGFDTIGSPVTTPDTYAYQLSESVVSALGTGGGLFEAITVKMTDGPQDSFFYADSALYGFSPTIVLIDSTGRAFSSLVNAPDLVLSDFDTNDFRMSFDETRNNIGHPCESPIIGRCTIFGHLLTLQENLFITSPVSEPSSLWLLLLTLAILMPAEYHRRSHVAPRYAV